MPERFRAFIRQPDFPCVGAKSALSKGQLNIIIGRDIRSAWDDLAILPALEELASSYRSNPELFLSFAVLFEEYADIGEAEFEQFLWERLQSLSDKDEWLGNQPDPRVSQDPDDPHFSLSFGGEAFFVVGMHPQASRPARRFERPALIFNLHGQFEQLRANGLYQRMRGKIMDRDIALSGSPNPMLASHGTISAARQYSGRAVNENWQCPFSRTEKK